MSARKSFPWFKYVILLILAGAAFAGWRWYAKRSKNDVIDYKTAVVSRGDITQAVTANGQISPVKSVTVGSQVSGIITEIRVDFNSKVTNGQIIAQIDPSTYNQTITQLEADLANSKAALELTELNFRRANDLLTNQLIAQSEFDKAQVDLHQAQAVVKMRQASLKKAQVDLDRTTIYSPIDGVVISRAVDVGQTVAASFNTPTLFSIANDLRSMRIEAMVSEADVGGVQEGQPVTFTVDAYPGRLFRGDVTQVRYAAVTNQNVVNYVSVIGVTNDQLKLRPGMTATASIITAEKKDVLRLPNATLRFRLPEKAVVTGATNAPGLEGQGTNRLGSGGGPRGEGATTNGETRSASGREGLSPEERRRRMESLTPEQREQWRARMRERGGGGPGRSGGGGASDANNRGSGEGPSIRTVYVLETNTVAGVQQPVLRAVTVKTGITDGNNTEVLEGLKEGELVVSGINLPAAAASAVRPGASSPFGGPFGGGMRPR